MFQCDIQWYHQESVVSAVRFANLTRRCTNEVNESCNVFRTPARIVAAIAVLEPVAALKRPLLVSTHVDNWDIGDYDDGNYE